MGDRGQHCPLSLVQQQDFCVRLAMYGNVWQCMVVVRGCGSRRTTNRRLGTTFVCELAMYGNVWWWCKVVVLGEPQTEDSGRLLCANSALYGGVWWCMVVFSGGGGCGCRRTTNRRLGTTFVCELGNVWWCMMVVVEVVVLGEPQTEDSGRLLCANSAMYGKVRTTNRRVWWCRVVKPKKKRKKTAGQLIV
jgi:hypothetical protein